MSANDPSGSHIKEWVLDRETEYRFELDPGSSLAIRLLGGFAEVFGAELAEGKYYLFGHECKAAVFTWQGCTIEMRTPSTEYVSDETPMYAYANVHLALEKMRSVCKILANYAVRAGQGWTPIYVNTDPSEGGWTIPGTISAVPVTASLGTSSPASPLGSAATSAPTILSSNALLPLVYWYGHPEIKRNPLLMDRLIRNLGENVVERHDLDPEGRASGIIVDTPSSFASSPSSTSTDHRQTLIRACVDAFRINVILVVGHEKLNVEMQRTYGSRMTVVKIPKSGGVRAPGVIYRRALHLYPRPGRRTRRAISTSASTLKQIYTYMYGQVVTPPRGLSISVIGDADFDGRLAPSSSVIPFGELTFLRIGEKSMAPSSALPIGATRTLDPASPGSGLLNAIVALLAPPVHPEETERYDEEVLDLQVSGFLAITNVDVPNRKLTILSPSPGSFSGRTATIGSFEWSEP
ncbi:hypothetical protein H4582DRAFT_1904620 [Lactarius indigo]|nr:hypothetical protein H4582DRAFT_1904620 [Lactarius indigo]